MNEAKTALGLKIVATKKQKQWTWDEVAEKLGYSKVWVCAACLGQMSMTPETAEKTGILFDLSPQEIALLQEPPYRGSLPTAVPTDPLIYRFYELISVYGTTWKELIHEEFGDGMDMFEALGSLLATEDGETIATTLVSLKDATEKIALNMEMQNKILVKIAAAMNKMVPATPTVVDSA